MKDIIVKKDKTGRTVVKLRGGRGTQEHKSPKDYNRKDKSWKTVLPKEDV